MARITLRQLLDHAAEHGYGVPAFNINNMEQGLAIMEAAAACDAPVILQASRGARSYAGDIMLAKMIDALAEMYPDDPALHAPGPRQQRSDLPDGDPPRLHLGDDGRLAAGRRQDAGRLRLQCRDHRSASPSMAHCVGASVEGELGVLGSLESGQGEAEDGHGAEGTLSPRPAADRPRPGGRLRRRAPRSTRSPSPCGTSHGAYKFTRKPDGDILAMRRDRGDPRASCRTRTSSCTAPPRCRRNCRTSSTRFGGEMPQTYGVPVEEIVRGIRHGVRKVNIDTDCRLAMTGQFRRSRRENPSEFDPRKFLKPAMDAHARSLPRPLRALRHRRQRLARSRSSRWTRWPGATPRGALDPQIATAKAA